MPLCQTCPNGSIYPLYVIVTKRYAKAALPFYTVV
jgi:hypothetical protein